jgi:hypothetical protein
MLEALGPALRSASANGCGGVTRPQIFCRRIGICLLIRQVARLSDGEFPVGPMR